MRAIDFADRTVNGTAVALPEKPMRSPSTRFRHVTLAAALAVTACVPSPRDPAAEDGTPARLRIEVSYPAAVHAGPLTGLRLRIHVAGRAGPGS